MDNEVKPKDQPLGPHADAEGVPVKEQEIAEGPLGPHRTLVDDSLNSDKTAEA